MVHVAIMPGHLLPIVLEVLDRGVHVSVEKSPGIPSEETRQMAGAEAASKGGAIGAELMEPVMEREHRLSAITIQSLADLGYVVDAVKPFHTGCPPRLTLL